MTEFFQDGPAFRRWLEANPTATEVWVGLVHKSSGRVGITYAQALDEALCFGWIDGLIRPFDETSAQRRFTPRKPKGNWSKINIGHVERLTAEGRMRPAGLAQVAAAQADGRWEAAYHGSRAISVPQDLQDFLDASEKERKFFEGLSSANRYAVLYRLDTARTAETRARRLGVILKMLTEGKTFH